MFLGAIIDTVWRIKSSLESNSHIYVYGCELVFVIFYIWWIQHIIIPIRRSFILTFTTRVSTDLCRVVIAAFLVLQILRVFNVIRRVQFTRDSPAVVWHALPLRETFYLAQLAVWRGNFSDEVPFQSFSREIMNEIQNPAVIFQEKGRARKIKCKRRDGTR